MICFSGHTVKRDVPTATSINISGKFIALHCNSTNTWEFMYSCYVSKLTWY